MAIGLGRLTELLESEISEIKEINTEQRKILLQLCRTIFLREVSQSSGVSAQKIGEQIRAEIVKVADKIGGK